MSKMFNSAIASGHHYYIVFFEAKELNDLDELMRIFPGKKFKENLPLPNIQSSSLHFQLELSVSFGGIRVATENKSREIDGVLHSWFDFYVGEIRLPKKRLFYICYPYVRLGKYIESCLSAKKIKRIIYKPELATVLAFMREHSGTIYNTKDKMLAEIVKYSAKVLEDSASKINISGRNPLKSKVYKLISEANGISVETTSLKMSCYTESVGRIELSFDRLGNYRFWIPSKKQETTFSALPALFRFFHTENLLLEDTFFNTYTLLEDENN